MVVIMCAPIARAITGTPTCTIGMVFVWEKLERHNMGTSIARKGQAVFSLALPGAAAVLAEFLAMAVANSRWEWGGDRLLCSDC